MQMLKFQLLMLHDLGAIILLIVIAVCLIFLTLTLRQIWNTLLKSIKDVEPPTPTGGEHPSYYDEVIKQERAFFVKNVNRGDGEYRTVTFSNAVLQAFNVLTNKTSSTQTVSNKKLVLAVQGDNASTATTTAAKQVEEVPSPNTEACLISEIDNKALQTNVDEYVTYVGNLIGADQVGKVCLCPDGVNYCNWSSTMFEAFMVDTLLWNVVSVQIFDNYEVLLSTSSINQIAESPGGRHSLVTMINQATLANLPEGTIIRIVFKWLDGAVLRCIVMMNVIPSKDGIETPPAE